MRLTAGLDVELEVRMALADALEQAVESRCIVAREEGQDQARLGEQLLDHVAGNGFELAAACDRLALGEPEPGAIR